MACGCNKKKNIKKASSGTSSSTAGNANLSKNSSRMLSQIIATPTKKNIRKKPIKK